MVSDLNTSQHWDADTIAEAASSWRAAKAVYWELAAQQLWFHSRLSQATAELDRATRLYERCLQENATVPEHDRQTEALIGLLAP